MFAALDIRRCLTLVLQCAQRDAGAEDEADFEDRIGPDA
jgi:hypothetical protein